MSGHVHYLRELPVSDYILDDVERPSGQRFLICTPDVFFSIADYTRSQPTGPSPGVVYRKNLLWPYESLWCPLVFDSGAWLNGRIAAAANWFVYVTVRDPDDDHGVLHHPYKPIFVDWDLGLLPPSLVVDRSFP